MPNLFDDLSVATDSGDSGSTAANLFDDLTPTTDQELSSLRNTQFQELRDNPQLVGDLFSLTHREVGRQGAEAQQAFIETVFNRAAARGQTLDQAMHDSGYYPRISRTPAEMDDESITNYGNLLGEVGKGSNLSGYATGNASGKVQFAGGPQTLDVNGERFGVEGPDLDWATKLAGGTLPVVTTKGEGKVTGNLFDDLTLPEPSPTELPEPTPTTWAEANEQKLKDFVQGKSFTEGLGEGIVDNIKGLVPHTQEGVTQFGQIMAAPSDPNAFLRNAVAAASGMVSDVQNAIKSGKLSSYQSGKAIGSIAPQAMMLIGGLRTGGAIPTRAVPPPPPGTLGAGVRGSGKFRAAYNIDKTLGDMLEGIGASRESGTLMGELSTRNLTAGLDKAQIKDLGDYLVSERLERQRQVRTNDLNNNPNPSLVDYLGTRHDTPHSQILPASEMQRIASDPKIKSAIDYYRTEIEPKMENIHQRAGTNPKAIDQLRGAYIPLIKSEAVVPKNYGKSIGKLSTKTRFAKRATGTAAEYNTNVGDLIKEGFSEALRKARINDFFKEAKSKGLADHVIQYGPEGKMFSVFDENKSFDLGTPEGRKLHQQLQSATKQAIDEPSGPVVKGIRALQRGATTIALSANPAEIVNHMRRQLHVGSNVPPVGQGLLHRLSVVIPYIGPKTSMFVRTVFRNADSPAFQATLQDIFDAGGGSARSLSNFYELKNPVAKYSGLKYIQHKTHTLLFGIPKGRGFNGWDLRMRVALEDIRRAVEGNKDPQRIREFANQIGQYGSNQDWLINAAKQINPYAGTSLPMRWTEMKQAVGLSGLKESFIKRKFRQAETMLRGTGGTILGLVTANYLLSGKWPWQNDKGHEFDLNTGTKSTDGKTVYVKFRVIAPDLSRVVNTTGLPLLTRESAAENPDYLAALGTAAANAGLSLVGGPLQNAALTATTGKVPYFVKSPGRAPELMDIAQLEPGKEGSRGLEQLKQAAISLNPLAEGLIPSNAKRHDVELPGALKYLERPVAGFHGIKPLGDVFTQSYEKKAPKHPQTERQRAATIRRKLKKKAQSGG